MFAYDIKMGNIQKLVASLQAYDKEQLIIFDKKGTIIGSSEEDYLGGNLMQSTEENREQLTEANNKLKQADSSISRRIERSWRMRLPMHRPSMIFKTAFPPTSTRF